MNTQKKSGTESGTKSINNVDFIGIKGFSVGQGGLEPPTSPLSGVRSNQLSYRPMGRMKKFKNDL